MLKFEALVKDGPWPNVGETVMVLLRPPIRSIDATSGSREGSPKTAIAAVVPAILDYIQDGFGETRPKEWKLLSASHTDGKSLGTHVSAIVQLGDVVGWCRIELTTSFMSEAEVRQFLNGFIPDAPPQDRRRGPAKDRSEW